MPGTVSWTLGPESTVLAEELRLIPGARVRRKGIGHRVTATLDLEQLLAARIGRPGLTDLHAQRSEGAELEIPSKMLPWQREGIASLVSGKSFGLWWACGLGKSSCRPRQRQSRRRCSKSSESAFV